MSKNLFQWDHKQAEKPERAIVVVPFMVSKSKENSSLSCRDLTNKSEDHHGLFDPYRLQEAEGLARAISLDLVKMIPVSLKKLHPATLLGTGKLSELEAIITSSETNLVIIDHFLSPVQQRNLEKTWKTKVLDRTGLILEIFGARARTGEGKLQVELAHLNYQKSRLVRSWTHLERQRGGLGFVGGPGETQIEADRRLIRQRIKRLEKDLEKVRTTRSLHRAGRNKVPHPVVALVGYTNAGKFTLFNRITGANVYARDQLFATLDPTLRKIRLPDAAPAILSDTVGFISNLPESLVAAFRATLEEVTEADLIVHVRDMSHPMNEKHCDDVYNILDQLGIDRDNNHNILEVWNKMDLVMAEQPDDKTGINPVHEHGPFNTTPPDNLQFYDYIPVSAITGDGVDNLLSAIERRIMSRSCLIMVELNHENIPAINWVYSHGHILDSTTHEDGSMVIRLRLPDHLMAELNNQVGMDAVRDITPSLHS